MINPALHFFHDCYLADSADLNLWHLGKLAESDGYQFTDEDVLVCAAMPRQPLPDEIGEVMTKRLAMYQRERTLVLGAFFIAGVLEVNGNARAVFSPLLYFYATIERQHQHYYATMANPQPQLNVSLLQALGVDVDKIDIARVHQASYWTPLLRTCANPPDASSVLRFPLLASRDQCQSAMRSKRLQLLPVTYLALIEKPKSSRAIAHELKSLSVASEFSAPLQALLGSAAKQPSAIKQSPPLPGLLSSAQQSALQAALSYRLSVLEGPPGTGKSYTIAAIAAAAVAAGQSVLVLCQQGNALSVIASMLGQRFYLPELAVQAHDHASLSDLKRQLESVLKAKPDGQTNTANVARSQRQLQSQWRQLSRLEQKLSKLNARAVKHGSGYVFSTTARVFTKLMQQWHRWRTPDLDSHSLLLKQCLQAKQQLEQLTQHWLNAAVSGHRMAVVESHRQQLQSLLAALRSRDSQSQLAHLAQLDYQVLTKALPIWLTTPDTLHRLLPLQAEVFDLVIVDEASQLAVAPVLPALQRAKRAVIVGDSQQLRHVSFVSQRQQQELLLRQRLPLTFPAADYRNTSMLDMALAQRDAGRSWSGLDEHFRCHPQLIEFSNRQFYQSALKIMTARPHLTADAIRIQRVNGVRDHNGVNQMEAEAAIAQLQLWLRDGVAGDTFAVISPFRAQADYISQRILAVFTLAQINQFQLRADTPYGFQGDERTAMVISFAVDAQSARAASYLNKHDVFNVAITRAQQRMVVLTSVNESELPPDNLLRQYLQYIAQYQTQTKCLADGDSFQQQVQQQLQQHGYRVYPGYHVAGMAVDMLVGLGQRYVAIDLVGFPGAWQDAFSLAHYQLFDRAGIAVLPLSYIAWQHQRPQCLSAIAQLLSED